MYAYIKGELNEKGDNYTVIEAGGIGYMIYCSGRTLLRIENLPEQDIQLFLEHRIRENDSKLYGFIDKKERQWFKTLTSVQGVGAKHALALLSLYTPDELYSIISKKAEQRLTKASGIGAKIASRIITEVIHKINKSPEIYIDHQEGKTIQEDMSEHIKMVTQIQEILQKMGFEANKSKKAAIIAERNLKDETDIQTLIKYALKELKS